MLSLAVPERHWSEGLLRGREDQLHLYAQHSPVAVAMFDRDLRYVMASRRWMDDYRLSEPIVGRHHYDVFPDTPERWKRVHGRCLAGAVEKCEEDSFTHVDGSEGWIRWEVRPWCESDGSVGGIIIFSEDITERKRSEQAIREREERMRFALENAEVGIWDMDYATGALKWSETLEEQFGLAAGTFPGTSEAFFQRVHVDDRPRVRNVIRRAQKSGNDFSMEYRIIRSDGAIRWARGSGRVLLDENGRPTRGVGISQDVTARRTLEAQYQQSQKMEAVGRLAGGVAHDFNNVLTAISGYCEMLLERVNENDPLRADILEIQKAGATAAALTRQLLAFSRKQVIEPALLDVNVVASDMQGMLGRLIGEHIEFRVTPSDTPAVVSADRGQLEQILLNLAVNARDAMPEGGTLGVEIASVELDEEYAASHFEVKPGRYVALTVTDSGVGMTPDVQSHLFEPFFTTKESGRGTGLGLATVHGVVAQCGGTVAVYSEVGKGTSFTIYLPEVEGRPVAPVLPVRRAETDTRSRTVLVVEDAPMLRDLARRMLRRHGYKVLTAAGAGEALQVLDSGAHIDVLLTDIVMPGRSGTDLAAEVSARRPDIKVLYMSGYTEETAVLRRLIEQGAAFLQKPFTFDALGDKLREVLAGQTHPG